MGLLTNSNFAVTFDAASLARFARMVNAAPVFARYYQGAMSACVLRVQGAAKDNAAQRFAAPTGNLLRNIQGRVASPWIGYVGVTRSVPYARRREFGFSGMTDSLGRFYPNDPGQFYLRDALSANRPFIQATFAAATAMAVRDFII